MTKSEWFYVPVNLKNAIIYYLKVLLLNGSSLKLYWLGYLQISIAALYKELWKYLCLKTISWRITSAWNKANDKYFNACKLF